MISKTRNDLIGIDPSLASKAKKKDAHGVESKQAGLIGDPQNSSLGHSAADSYGVQLSSKALEMAEARNKALGIAQATSAIRQEKVDSLKKRIADGSYEVDAGRIADGIAAEALKDHVAMSMQDETREI